MEWLPYFSKPLVLESECLLALYCKATQGLLATILVVSNLGQVTRTIPESASPSSSELPQQGNVRTFGHCRFKVHQPLNTAVVLLLNVHAK
ncbi:hypothetical protein TNCV_4604321 [Trichonephila clavipes]|nr:hypothetical protein TNCV_4604321 [Trichonephila clavipes]